MQASEVPRMTTTQIIQDLTPRKEYTSTAGQTVFPVPFPFFDNVDLKVYIAGKLQTLGTHYTVTGAGTSEGGAVTFTTALGAGVTVVIRRLLVIERVTDFPLSGPFDIEELNREFDRIVAMLQQLKETTDRVIQLDPTVSIINASWDAQGRRIINVGYPIGQADAATKIYVDNNAGSGGGGGPGGPGGGGGDLSNVYVKQEVDYFLNQLELELRADYDAKIAAITTVVNQQLAAALGNSYRIRQLLKYTNSAQFNKANYPWLKGARFIVQAGGGGGGYAKNTTNDVVAIASGGGGGECVVTDLIHVSAIPAGNLAVTVGAGGAGGVAGTETAAQAGQASTVQGIASAAPGGGGASMKSGSGKTKRGNQPGSGGIGGSGGFFTVPGQHGERGLGLDEAGTIAGWGGAGGNSLFGVGGPSQGSGGSSDSGLPGSGYGSGGGGAYAGTSGDRSGAAGQPGIVFVELYE